MGGLRLLALWGVVLTSACVGGDEGLPDTAPAESVSTAPSMPVEAPVVEGQKGVDGLAVNTGTETTQIEWTLEQVSAARALALSNLEGVRATRWPDVVMAMSDGRILVSKAYGAFESFDPSTGSYRSLYIDEFGGGSAQEILWPAGYPSGVGLGWRDDPFRPLSAPSPGAVAAVVETDRESRMSWEITWSEGEDVVGRDVVDMRTGLLVESGEVWPVLSDVGPIDSLPAEFPGVFPDDVEVDRDFDNPDGQRSVTLEEAASEFTPGLIVPSNLPADAAVFVYDATLGREDPRKQAVTIVSHDGFDTTRIVVSKFLPYDDVTMTAGDVACYDFDQDQVCDYKTHLVDTVEAGELAGRDLTVIDGVVTVYDAGRTIEITNVDPQQSLEIANSFIATERDATDESDGQPVQNS